MNTCRIIVIGLLAVVPAAAGCAEEPTASDEYQELARRLEAVEAERDQLAEELASASELPPILQEFEAAYEARDFDRVRALYTDDGIFITTGSIHAIYHGSETELGTLDVDGQEFRRVATLHSGDLQIFDAVQVGDRAVSFGWQWSDFAAGTGVLHLRDGRIVVCSLAVTQSEITEPL